MHNFKKLDIWINSLELSKFIYLKTVQFPKEEQFGLISQIRRSSISIVSNIAEGFERKSNKEFTYFLNVAKGSSGELRSQLYICLDLKYITQETFNQCQALVSEISGMLNGFISYLDSQNKKPSNP